MRALRRVDVRLWGALTLGFLLGSTGEGLLFTWAQCRALQDRLVSDFRLLAFIPEDLAPDRREVVRELLSADPDVEDAVWVGKDEALAALGAQDPELAKSAALLGRNPLPSAFELTVSPDAMDRLGTLVEGAEALPEVSRVEFKAWQAQAILEARAYLRFVAVVAALGLWVVCAAAFVATLPALAAPEQAGHLVRESASAVGWGVFGAVFGAAVVLSITVPLRATASFWGWPPLWSQAALAASGAAGGWLMARFVP